MAWPKYSPLSLWSASYAQKKPTKYFLGQTLRPSITNPQKKKQFSPKICLSGSFLFREGVKNSHGGPQNWGQRMKNPDPPKICEQDMYPALKMVTIVRTSPYDISALGGSGGPTMLIFADIWVWGVCEIVTFADIC